MEENAGISLAASAWSLAFGIVFSPLAMAVEQDIIQQQRQKAIKAQLQPPTPDVRLSTPSRDAEHANQTLSPIFDKEKEQNRLKEAQLIGEIGNQAADIARAQGEIDGLNQAKKDNPDIKAPGPDATQDQRDAYVEKLKSTDSYKEVMKDFGTGSALQKGIQAATAAIQGLAGGDISNALAGASAPYLATVVKNTVGEENPAANLMAHAAINAALALAKGENAADGAAGAAVGEAMGMIAKSYYNKPVSELSETEKQTVSALATLAAGLAGGLAGGSTADAVAGAQAGKTTVENNWLSATQALTFDKELSDCQKASGNCLAVIDKWKQVSDKQSAETDQKLKDDPLGTQIIEKESAQGGYDMTERPVWLGNIPGVDVMTSDEAKAYVRYLNSQDLANIDQNSPGWTKFAAFVSNPENQAAVASLAKVSNDVVQLAKAAITSQSYPVTIKSMQVGLRNSDYVDTLKKEMLNGNFKFSDPKGKIAGYVDQQGRYYITEGNHRMVAAQEIYKQTGDAKYIDQLLKNGVWTQSKNAPAGSTSMPKR